MKAYGGEIVFYDRYTEDREAIGGAIAAERGLALVYVSTGSVFSGDQRAPYIETDEPGPVNAYARAK
ncbi:MAG: sugar nucleotide-binding protein, partial [Synechococcales cyanobacterium CRU_2_2]|nr:sugar nucleotide-binding protein [Synechococcales cyanobacterium CRU_2_2]